MRILRLSLLCLLATNVFAAEPADLGGLWKAYRRFGGIDHARLLVMRSEDGYRADILGSSPPVSLDRGALTFTLPGGQGSFRGRVEKEGGRIEGHWYRNGNAVPVTLASDGAGRWSG